MRLKKDNFREKKEESHQKKRLVGGTGRKSYRIVVKSDAPRCFLSHKKEYALQIFSFWKYFLIIFLFFYLLFVILVL